MSWFSDLLNIKNIYANPFEMARDGIMGMNQRNVNYIGRYSSTLLLITSY